jgi:hypothetical protein
MSADPRPLLLQRTAWRQESEGRPTTLLRWLATIALHAIPAALLLSALPPKPRDLGGAFGQSVSVTLVSGAPRPARQDQPRTSNLSALAQRLSEQTLTTADVSSLPAATAPSPPTRLSDLFDRQGATSGQLTAKGPLRPAAGADDDPFARASVSYRGDDPAKAARLLAKAKGCAPGAQALRLLVIINAEGYLMAKPRPLDATANEPRTARIIAAVERCAPFTDAATPGPPRSYEINLG